MNATPTTEDTTFSALLRTRTPPPHGRADHGGFMSSLMDGTLPLEGYIDMLAQHHYTYEALEAANPTMAQDPVAAVFVDPALDRLEALTADLEDLAGPDWAEKYPPTPATEAYVARLREVTDWPGGWVAHHYTRYLGDLSGGQIIGRVTARTYQLNGDHGGRFAVFEGIEDRNAYKDGYRAKLDAAPWDREEQERIVAEIREAYRFNTEVFADLTHRSA